MINDFANLNELCIQIKFEIHGVFHIPRYEKRLFIEISLSVSKYFSPTKILYHPFID